MIISSAVEAEGVRSRESLLHSSSIFPPCSCRDSHAPTQVFLRLIRQRQLHSFSCSVSSLPLLHVSPQAPAETLRSPLDNTIDFHSQHNIPSSATITTAVHQTAHCQVQNAITFARIQSLVKTTISRRNPDHIL